MLSQRRAERVAAGRGLGGDEGSRGTRGDAALRSPAGRDGHRRLPGFPHPAAAASRASPLIRGLFPPPRHADGIFNKAYRKLLGQLSARKYLHSLMAKRVG